MSEAPQQISFLDTATRRTGWTSGTGECLPDCGAFLFPQVGDDLGWLGECFESALNYHVERYRPVAIGYESPIHKPTDALLTMRKLYGMGFQLETFCRRRGIHCFEKDCRDIKREMTGNRNAAKADMVHVALKIGMSLPDTKESGREDAADSLGGFVMSLRDINPALSRRWDSLIWGRRGALL